MLKNAIRYLKQIVQAPSFLESIERHNRHLANHYHELNSKIDRLMLLSGEIADRQVINSTNINDHEFRVSSQWGEDGIIAYLLEIIEIKSKTFIEFGVEDYKEANTRWLLQKRNWCGLIIDGSSENILKVRSSDLYWRNGLTAVSSFITAENINDIITANRFLGELGILSIDIDGVDYWIWKAINCVSPCIVIIEYNSLLGHRQAVTVPYRADFNRTQAHFSNNYYGASIAALKSLGDSKGYCLVGSNSAGNNAFFVRRDLMPKALRELTSEEAYIRRKYREARDQSGTLSYPTFEEERQAISNLPFVDVLASDSTNSVCKLL